MIFSCALPTHNIFHQYNICFYTSKRQKFGPLIPGIHVTPFPYEYHGITSQMAMDELDQLFKDTLHEDDVAAFLIEPVLGEGALLYLCFISMLTLLLIQSLFKMYE
jgi:adenosylmethionine-8-amino-7-oxononanoate aminotransferase